jgi:hypothetical protein
MRMGESPEHKEIDMRKMFLIAAALVALSVPAMAADMALKAQPPVISNGYPYGSSGLFFGAYTEGGGGSVNGSVPGVASASLTDTQAGLGFTVGYAWGTKGSPFAYTIEGDAGWTNINGSNQGFSASGPLHFEQRAIAWTPAANVIAQIPFFKSLAAQIPPFLTPNVGTTTSNLQFGVGAGADENDISMAFPGLASNREWRIAPMVGLFSMEQVSDGTALRSWAKVDFPQQSVCAGPIGKTACGGLSTQFNIGAGIYW